MADYTLAHVGLNAANREEAKQAAEMFELLFGLKVEEGNSSFFAGGVIETMKEPYKGTHGHIAIGTSDVPAAKAELEARGFTFDPSTAKYRKDGVLNAIYLSDEILGFAVHLVGK
ncbi:MAG: VOC family protein [Clostridiales bacterium]|nr:VOC family protein [Clostridiales bacterium]